MWIDHFLFKISDNWKIDEGGEVYVSPQLGLDKYKNFLSKQTTRFKNHLL